MKKKDVQNFFKDKKHDITIDYLYARNKNKGVSKNFISVLVGHEQKEAIKLLNKARTFEEFRDLIRANFNKLCTRYDYIFLFYITGSIYGLYEGGLDMVPSNIANSILNSGINPDDFKNVMDLYKDVLTNYINNHNEIKHKLLKKTSINGASVADFTEKFNEKSFKELCNLLFKSVDYDEMYRKSEFSKVICSLLTVYDRNILLTMQDFVKFEIEYGYFDRYYETLEAQGKIPSLDERLDIYNAQKKITSEQQYRLENLDLLEARINSLRYASKVIFLEKIKMIREEPDIQRRAQLVDDCFDYYEKEYRKEIIESAYSPGCSVEVGDFKTMEPAMLHLFLRNPNKLLDTYKDDLKSDILSSRGIRVTGEEALTEEEKKEYQTKIDYAINVLLNPVITSKSLEGKVLYSDSSGFRWYTSDTSNQISIGLFSPSVIMSLPNCVGVGFDRTSVDPKNIIISSSYYQTTNMGVDNLEVLPQLRFKNFSAPLSELAEAKKTEIVMYRDKDGIKTDSAYVFAVVNGLDEKRDRETILQAKNYAEKNQIKMVVFNTLKLKQSYEAMFEEDVSEEMELRGSKSL